MTPGAIDFEVLFNSSPNPYMVLDPGFNFVAANDAYLQVTMRRPEDIIGKNLFEAFPRNPADPDDTSTRMLRASLERVLAERRPDTLALIRYAIARMAEDGMVFEERYWSATHTPIFGEDGNVAYILQHTVDVTELQELKKALRAAEAARDDAVSTIQMEDGVFRRARTVQEANQTLDAERRKLRRLFEQAPGFIAVLRGPQHIFSLVNAAYAQLVGHRDVVGKSITEALPEVIEQGFVDLLDRVYTSGEPYIGRAASVLLQQGPGQPLEEVFLDFIYQPIIEQDGSVSGIFVQGHDVTEQKRAQEELQQLNETLEQRVARRTAELEARNRELQEFAYVASHDLQEPLRKIHSFADLLAAEYGPVLGTEGATYLDRILAGTRRMSSLIHDLLAYSRITSQARDFEPVDLNKVVEQALSDLQLRLQETGGQVNAGNLPEIEADPVQMEQLFQNLIGNALKFSRPGVPPVIEISGRIIAEDGNSTCRLEVRDNGIGFSQQYAERIFAPFQRLHTREAYPGTGIGLAICRRIVERHNGTIEAHGTPGEGSTFVIQLPAKRHTRELRRLMTM
jgi:PAS domain S-box-containing protein